MDYDTIHNEICKDIAFSPVGTHIIVFVHDKGVHYLMRELIESVKAGHSFKKISYQPGAMQIRLDDMKIIAVSFFNLQRARGLLPEKIYVTDEVQGIIRSVEELKVLSSKMGYR